MKRLIVIVATATLAWPGGLAAKGPDVATVAGPGIDGEVALADIHSDPWLSGLNGFVARPIDEEPVDGAQRWTLRWYWSFGNEGPNPQTVETLDVYLWPDGDAIGYLHQRSIVGSPPGWYSVKTEAVERFAAAIGSLDPATAVAGYHYVDGRGFVAVGDTGSGLPVVALLIGGVVAAGGTAVLVLSGRRSRRRVTTA